MPLNLTIRTNEDGVPVLAKAKEAIASIESAGSGGYAAVGPKTKKGDRAYGRYQVMGANIPSWTKQALGRSMTPKEFLASPEAQDAVFNHVFGGYVEKHGPQDAASMWFSGRPLAQAGGRRDILGTSPEQYVNKFTSAMGGQSAPVDSSGNSPGRFGLPVPASPVVPVGDVLPFPDLAKDPREPKALGGIGGPSRFGSKWRDPNYAADQFGVPAKNIKPLTPRSADVHSYAKARHTANVKENDAKIAELANLKPRTSSTNWLYSKEATKLGLPQRISTAVKENPALKPSLKEWVKTIEESPKSTDPAQMLQSMRQLSDLLKEFGF